MSVRRPEARAAARIALALMLALARTAVPAATPAAAASAPAPASEAATASASASASASAPAPAPQASRPVVIDAPGALKDLLAQHLDLARAARLTGDAALDDGEWSRLVAAAPAQVQALTATEGYFTPSVTVDVAPGADGAIRVHVAPGPRAEVGRVTLQFDGDLDRAASEGDAAAKSLESELSAAWALPAGTPFRNAAWSDAKAQWLARLRARGYGAAFWSGTSATADPATHQVRLFLVADSGPLFRAGALEVQGTDRQSPELVRRLAGIPPGAPLDESRLLAYQDRLIKTGLFDQATVTYDADPAQAAHTPLHVHVHEQRLQQTTVSAGVSANTGPRVAVEYANRLPFGLPVTATEKAVWGRDEKSFSLDLVTHPDARFKSWLTGMNFDRLVTSTGVTKTEWVRFGRTRDTSGFERLQFAQAERTVQCTVDVAECVDARAVSLNQHAVWRRVDSIVLPTEGWTLSTQVGAGLAGGRVSLHQYRPFTRLYGRFTRYWALPGQWYAEGRVELGQVVASGHVVLPETELFRAGGDESVRGYPYLSLAPTSADGVVGGRALATLSAEIAHPVSASLPTVWWAVFVDAGGADQSFSDLKRSHGTEGGLHYGPGVGIRWRSPVGPLRIDLARGRIPETGKYRGRLSLSIGIAF